jgi:hypothetical protein
MARRAVVPHTVQDRKHPFGQDLANQTSVRYVRSRVTGGMPMYSRFMPILVAVAILVFSPMAIAKHGNGQGGWKNGPGCMPPGQAKKFAARNCAPAWNHGSARSRGQHFVNAWHPTGHSRSTAERYLNTGNRVWHNGGHGNTHRHY